MTGKRKAPDQLELPGSSVRRRRGRHERALDNAARAARTADLVQPWHGAAISSARGLARALDDAELERDGWLVTRIASELRQTLDALGWLPEGANRDDLDDLVALFGGPAVSDPAKP